MKTHKKQRLKGNAIRKRSVLLAVMVVGLTGMPSAAQIAKYAILYGFTGGDDGSEPWGGLVGDSAGNLYGTTIQGGAYGYGTVFELTKNGTEEVLHSFTGGTDGGNPYTGLIRDAAGNLYGVTSYGGDLSCSLYGSSGCGTVFRVNFKGIETVLHSFTGGVDGAFPYASLIRDASGNLYGTTPAGGEQGNGTVFEVAVNGSESVLYAFTGQTDGGEPVGSLVRDGAGTLYGTTEVGGDVSCGCGTVFSLNRKGGETVLHSFTGKPDGEYPEAGLVIDPAGNLYGTAPNGGLNNSGVIFEVNANGTESVLFNFVYSTDGGGPFAGLVRDATGNLYGTTAVGGPYGDGTVFELNTTGSLNVLHSFMGRGDGNNPVATLFLDSQGSLWGTAKLGGIYNYGAVFGLKP